jgi:hypothetical protein
MKLTLFFQRNIFHEDDDEHIKIIEKYFDVVVIGNDWGFKTEKFCYQFRTSIFHAKQINRFEKFTNALAWAGKLRPEMLSEHFHFQTMDYIADNFCSYNDDFSPENIRLFVRPVGGDKTFAGNVFSENTFKNEFEFLKQKNVDPHIICMVSNPVPIKKEYRLIFIDGKYVSGSRYMIHGKLDVDSNVPSDIVEYGTMVHEKYDLPPWVVLDVGVTYYGPKVIELNQLETSSFYGADLDKIYKTWSEYYEQGERLQN